MMNELQSVAGEAPFVQSHSLEQDITTWVELPSHPSRRTGACTWGILTLLDEQSAQSTHTQAFRDKKNVLTYTQQAAIISSGQVPRLLACRLKKQLCVCVANPCYNPQSLYEFSLTVRAKRPTWFLSQFSKLSTHI